MSSWRFQEWRLHNKYDKAVRYFAHIECQGFINLVKHNLIHDMAEIKWKHISQVLHNREKSVLMIKVMECSY